MPAGTIVASGSLVGPGGQQGIPGPGGPSVVSADTGNLAKLGSDSKIYVPMPGRYYGTDTTNSTAYAVSVANDFTLTPGVVVFVTPSSNGNAANPTLNVNGTGAKPIVTRAGIAFFGSEIIANKTFGLVYDGSNWRIITPVNRFYNVVNPVNPAIECAGYDAINVSAIYTSATGAAITLLHIGAGVPILIDITNATGAAMSYYVNATDPAGNALAATYWIWTNALTGGPPTRMDNTSPNSLSNGNHFLALGAYTGGYLFLK